MKWWGWIGVWMLFGLLVAITVVHFGLIMFLLCAMALIVTAWSKANY